MMHTDSGLHVVRGNRVVTRKGIVIGGAWIPQAPQPSADAEMVQRALLSRRDRFIDLLLDAIDARWSTWFLLACAVGASLAFARRAGLI